MPNNFKEKILERIIAHQSIASNAADMFDENGDYNEFCYDGGYLAALEIVVDIIKDTKEE